MDVLEALNQFPAWKLHRYEQLFDNGHEVDVIFVCSICDGETWGPDGYGASPELAFTKAEKGFYSIRDEE